MSCLSQVGTFNLGYLQIYYSVPSLRFYSTLHDASFLPYGFIAAFAMAELPLRREKSLTGDIDSSESRQQPRPPEATSSRSGSRQSLPSLRDTLVKEITAQRTIAPGPKPNPPLFVPGVHEFLLDGLPIRTYKIGEQFYNMQQPPNETQNEYTRTTVDHREIKYFLKVAQQPEKARACGAGKQCKSYCSMGSVLSDTLSASNDRRPVDPPPVIELQVCTNGVDTTTSYDATFMLYASLENARPIAQGKMHTPTSIPVLAGVTVASAAYLEKPKRAAYFIFPDLSVRHEGWYRLVFSLFEGVKHELDADLGRPFDRFEKGSHLSQPVTHEGVFNRLEVRSRPFQVYSAKKFPGLAASTALSVLVADQGCRVRIRRDVRQRKRHQKADTDEGEDAPSSYQGTPHTAPYQLADHSRSASRNSLSSQYDRRESMDSRYGLPHQPSRQMSASSQAMTSPLLPTPTSSMPPPSAYSQFAMPRPSFDNLPRPGSSTTNYRYGPPPATPDQSTFSRTITPEIEPNSYVLPPLQSSGTGGIVPGPSGYDLPAPVARKRSPSDYDQQTSTKRGPGAQTQYECPALPGEYDIIEADDESVDEHEPPLAGPLAYSRAHGGTEIKPYRGSSFNPARY